MPRIKWVRAAGNVASYHVNGVTLPTLINSSIAGTLTNSSYRESNERIRQAQANSAQNPIGIRVAQPCVNGQNGYDFVTQFGFAAAPYSRTFSSSEKLGFRQMWEAENSARREMIMAEDTTALDSRGRGDDTLKL